MPTRKHQGERESVVAGSGDEELLTNSIKGQQHIGERHAEFSHNLIVVIGEFCKAKLVVDWIITMEHQTRVVLRCPVILKFSEMRIV